MDFIKISYTGKLKDGRVFDTTDPEVAKKENVFDSKRVYRPMPVVVGEKQVIPGLDEALGDMKAGEKKTVEITPEKAYGARDPAMVRLIPIKFFRDNKMNPVPGMPVEIDGMPARVQTVAGGRVRVDFNPELAGKTLVFDVLVEEKAKTEDEKIKFLAERSFSDIEGFDFSLTGKKLTVDLPEKAQRDRNLLVRKASFTAEAFKYFGLSEVTFTETWKNQQAEKEEKEEKTETKKKTKKE